MRRQDNLRDRALHPVEVRRGVQRAPGAEDQAVLRVEPDEFHLLPQVPADGLEDRRQDLGVQEERRADVEPKPVRLQGRRAPTHLRLAFEHGHAQARLRQQHGGRQAAGPGPDDHDTLVSHDESTFTEG